MRMGVDPGLTGALAVLSADGSRVIYIYDMPTVTKSTGKGLQVDAAGLSVFLGSNLAPPGDLHCYIEQVSARPGQGVTGMFSLGRSVGVVEGIVVSHYWPMTFVSPGAWKRRAGLIGQPKDASRTRALQLYPEMASQLSRKKDCGRADAILIARFGPKE